MEQLLEAISDAVSSMVLYSVEAEEGNAAIPNILPGAQGVKSTVDYLVDLAKKSAELWKNFNQEEMRNKMVETCDSITESTGLLVESATILSNMPFNKPAKKTLLKGAKGIMEHMVVLLQQADLYEVTRLIKSSRKTESKLKIMVGLEPGETFFSQAAQDLVTSMVETGKIVNKRINEIDDYSFKRRFEEANTSMKVELPIILQHYANYQKNGPNDKYSLQEGTKIFKTLLNVIEEIIVVARLSSKSPFDLSMIQGLDLRDEDDLKDAGILIAHERENLLRALAIGDANEAARALKAIKKTLGDQILISKALAKSADPLQKQKLEDSANNAQRLLDTVIQEFSKQVEELLRNPDNKTVFDKLKFNLDLIKDASNQMVNSAAKITANDVANSNKSFDALIEIVRENTSKSDIPELNVNLPRLRGKFGEVVDLSEGFAKGLPDPSMRSQIESAVYEKRNRGQMILGRLDQLKQDLSKSLGNPDIQNEMYQNLDKLGQTSWEIVKVVSLGDPSQLYSLSDKIDKDLQTIKEYASNGDKKELQKALRLARAELIDYIDMAKSIARTTDDALVKESLESAILKADDLLLGVISDLYLSAHNLSDDTSNPNALQALEEIISSIDAMKADIIGAVSKDLIADNTKELEAKLTQLVYSIKNADQEASVQTLKAIVEQIKKQAHLAQLSAHLVEFTDEPRSERIKERAVELTNTAPELVKAVKANLVSMTPDNLQLLGQSINSVRENNRDLSNAILLSAEEELLENSAKIDVEMRRLQNQLANGQTISMTDVNNLLKKVNNQIKLANQHAMTLKDPNAKKQLLDSTKQLNDMVGLLLAACKSHVENPQDQNARKQVSQLLDQALKANMNLMSGSLSAADELVYGTPHLLKLIQRLEEAILSGNPDEIRMAYKDLNEELTRQLFLARIAEASMTDPERKKQLQDAIAQLEGLQNQLLPGVMDFLSNPNSKEALSNLQDLLRRLKGGVEKVSSIAATNPSEHLQSKSFNIANELHRLQQAVRLNNTTEANDSVQKALNGIKQQIALSKLVADQTENLSQKKAINDLSDRLEKQALVLQLAVKEYIANPSSASAKQKVNDASSGVRVLMAQLIAASSNKVPEEQIISIASGLKKELDQVSSILSSGNQKQIKDTLDSFKFGEQQQKIELLKSFNEKVQDPFVKRDIQNAIKDLEKKIQSTHQFLDSHPQIITSASDLKQLKQFIDSGSNSANNVIIASTQSPDDRIMSQAVKVLDNLEALQKNSKSGNKVATDQNNKQFREEIGDIIQLIKTAADGSRDQHKKVALNDISEKLKSLAHPLSNTATNLASKPSDANLSKELDSLISQTRDLLGKAVVNSSKDQSQPKDQLEKAVIKASNDIHKVQQSIQSNDLVGLGDATASLKDAEKRIQLISSHLPIDSNDRAQILKNVENLTKNSIPTVIATANNAILKGDTKIAKQSLPSQSQNVLSDIINIIALTNKLPEDKIIHNDKSTCNEMNQLLNHIKSPNSNNDKQTTQQLLDTTVKVLTEQSILANVLSNSTSNPQRKQELLSQSKKLNQTLDQLINSNTTLSNKDIESKLMEAQSSHQVIVKEAIQEKKDKEEKARLEKEERDRLEKERLLREKEEREKAEQDEVLKAAQKIAERTKDLAKDKSTSEGKLYSTASDIATIMRNLSIAASSNDKVGMIQCSKQLSEHVNTYLSQAKETATKCTDPKLKEQIITAAQAAKNFTVQLKIIAAVKAASDDDDPSSNKAQLVKCAKGLAKAIVQTINSVEIGSIRAK